MKYKVMTSRCGGLTKLEEFLFNRVLGCLGFPDTRKPHQPAFCFRGLSSDLNEDATPKLYTQQCAMSPESGAGEDERGWSQKALVKHGEGEKWMIEWRARKKYCVR